MEGLVCFSVRQGLGEPVTHWLGPVCDVYLFSFLFGKVSLSWLQ